MTTQYTPYAIPLLLVVILVLMLAVYAWPRRHIPGARVFILLMAALVIWTMGHFFEWTFLSASTKFFWVRTQYFGIVFVPVLWLLFILQTTGRSHLVTRRNIILLLIVPATTFIGIWTNELHHQFWATQVLSTINNYVCLKTTMGLWFWVHATYSYVLLLAGTYFLVLSYRKSSHLYRQQLLLLLIGSFAPWVSNAITIFELVPSWRGLDLTPFGFLLTSLTMAWALFRYQLLDIVPIARDITIEKMAEGVIVLNTNQQIVDINPAAERLIGRSAADVIGQPAGEILAPWADLVAEFRDVTSTQQEIRVGQADNLRFYSVSVSPIQDRRERLSGRVIVLRDITERKQMEQEIVQARDEAVSASNMKTRLLANISHDLRSPLGAILGYTEILQTGVAGEINPKQSDMLTKIIDSAEQLLNFVNNLVGQAQLDSGKVVFRITNFAPEELLQAIQSTAKALAYAKSLEIDAQVSPQMPSTVGGDPYWLRQIMINLVSNAIKFTDKGIIRVEILPEDAEHWAIRVTDTGRGIPSEALETIFDPFEQIDSEKSTGQTRGSGLGLSIVKQLAVLMGGSVNVHSVVGQGSTFTVILPYVTSTGNHHDTR